MPADQRSQGKTDRTPDDEDAKGHCRCLSQVAMGVPPRNPLHSAVSNRATFVNDSHLLRDVRQRGVIHASETVRHIFDAHGLNRAPPRRKNGAPYHTRRGHRPKAPGQRTFWRDWGGPTGRGAPGRIRTCDLSAPEARRSIQLSYGRVRTGRSVSERTTACAGRSQCTGTSEPRATARARHNATPTSREASPPDRCATPARSAARPPGRRPPPARPRQWQRPTGRAGSRRTAGPAGPGRARAGDAAPATTPGAAAHAACAYDQPHDGRRRRAERQPDADLAPPPLDQPRHQAIEADAAQHQSDSAEPGGGRSRHAGRQQFAARWSSIVRGKKPTTPGPTRSRTSCTATSVRRGSGWLRVALVAALAGVVLALPFQLTLGERALERAVAAEHASTHGAGVASSSAAQSSVVGW